VQQSLGVLTGDPAVVYGGEFPGQIFRVLNSGVQSPRAEGGEQVGGVSGEKHPPDLERLGDSFVEAVHR